MVGIALDGSDKASLRRTFREARRSFAQATGPIAAQQISIHMQRVIDDLGISQVCLYRPLPEEASFALSGGFFYPRILSDGGLQMLRPRGAFTRGPLGIEEPDPAHSDELLSSEPLLVFCPAVAVDGRGGRLGMGQGYYDRFFQDHPHAIRVGVVFQIQISRDQLRVDDWDQPLDWIVTDSQILRTPNILRRSS